MPSAVTGGNGALLLLLLRIVSRAEVPWDGYVPGMGTVGQGLEDAAPLSL